MSWFKETFCQSISTPKLVTLEDSTVRYSLQLIGSEKVTHDTRLIRFALPTPEHVLGLPVGQHLHVYATINGENVVRPYTPVSSDDDKGHMDLVIKIYRKNKHMRYPNGGIMSQFLDALQPGDFVEMRGPSGRMVYKGRGQFAVREEKHSKPVCKKYKKIGMMAGGTGITPMLQIMRQVFKDPQDTTCISLLFANQHERDIIMREELEKYAKKFPSRFRLHYTVGKAPEGWEYSQGYIDEKMIKDNLPPPSPDTIILMCGPPGMVKMACQLNLDKLGYDPSRRFAF